ncbi:MAG TPA: hypothetical protein VMY37_11645 [Thermoguttaceae bacterium]|nr:hypothetical protein [Thermoguttaceae bacterium]
MSFAFPRLRYLGAVLGLLLAGLTGSQTAQGVSFGVGGSLSFDLFPNDPAMAVGGFSCGSLDTDILGFYAEFEDHSPALFQSFDQFVEISSIEQMWPGGPVGNWGILVYVGDTPPGTEAQPGRTLVRGIWPATGGGISVGAGATINTHINYMEPEIARSIFTLENSSDYDITDGVIRLYEDRFLPGLTIPAHGSITVECQMAPWWEWSFGGICDVGGEIQPVFAFSDASVSPLGADYEQVFGMTECPTSGFAAGVLADSSGEGLPIAWLPQWNGTMWLGSWQYAGRGAPAPGYVTYFNVPETEPNRFDLYAYSADADQFILVGSGEQGQLGVVPEPSSLAIWCCLGAVGLAASRWRRKRQRGQAHNLGS